ncbi:nucleoside hydrolase-like domain-containing protein [Maribacter sp. MAR_2009_72]|uniref:nucleoside hydrolase-like domain-containing protein n=1 Tax=Maribacter sp. MAR_2009_72 TaxID=1250050 RepID=UPI00119AB713|nr:nucleoside hydrolase-like domain-containing protein [Maribacter sp. MAR_2009_72]TVZ17074.1 uncharacterized protein DUF1593 [Maribacter sp. MAR_2009_72]
MQQKSNKLYHLKICMATLFVASFYNCTSATKQEVKPRIIISSDIGGTDPDDFQSAIHLFMYADRFNIEGLISSPYGNGRTSDFLDMIALYEKDYDKLKVKSDGFPLPDELRNAVKQGAIDAAPYKGYSNPTEGSNWLIKSAKKKSEQPLWVLVWGGLEDLAQALHDAPEIKEKIKVYWIGGPNKKWSVNAYAYIAEHHPDLWMIEANATYRGWFMDEDSSEELKGDVYYDNFIKGNSAMGNAFKNYYNGEIKMGDTPSLAYLMHGDPNDPTSESWGGRFSPIEHSSRTIFEGNSTINDTVTAYAVLEYRFNGPLSITSKDSTAFEFTANNQTWPGYYVDDKTYGVRYSPKKPEKGNYVSHSDIEELNGQKGAYVSITPWPGKLANDDYMLGSNWYSDIKDPNYFIKDQQGAKTVSKHRKEFLEDWAERWSWLK